MLGSGHDLDHLLNTYTWDQLALQAKCVLRSRVQLLNLIIGPMVGSTGSTWKEHTVKGAAKRKRAPASKGTRQFYQGDAPDPEAKEAGLLRAFARAGVRVRSVPSAGSGSGAE